MKIIYYHYIRNFDSNYPNLNGIRFLDINSFRKQLDYFTANFKFITKSEFIDCIDNSNYKDIYDNCILLTFDDGLIDHYNYVFQELKKRNLWGIFFIPSKHLIYNKINNVISLHHLIGKYSSSKILNFIVPFLEKKIDYYIKEKEIFTILYLNKKKNNEEYNTILLKNLINSFTFFKNENLKDKVVDILLNEFLPNIKLNDIYLNKKQIKEMYDSGMLIGNHSINHNYMNDLNSDLINFEINETFKILDNIVGKKIYRIFAYPYGGFDSINCDVINILKKNNVKCSFCTFQDDFNQQYFKNKNLLQLIPRFSHKHFKFGNFYK
jgi:peptidoglycan/xylan/chitin deacetylase (PgdA/CDA1 family)